MNRFTWIALTLILLSFPFRKANGAQDDESNFGFGIQGGMSFSDMTTPGDVTTSSRTGFLAGVALEFRLYDFFYFAPEASFVQRGATLANISGARLDAFVDSIEVPAYFRFKFGSQVRPYIFVGPNFIFNVSNNLSARSGNQAANIAFNPRTFDFAADAGLGLEIGILFANLRYSLGLLDINDSSVSWRSRGFQLLLGLKFG